MSFQSGKIYKLVSSSTDKIYIGSTIRTLDSRLYEHKTKTNQSSSRLFGNDMDIVLIENYPCNSRYELEVRERYWIENTENVVNKTIPTRTRKEHYNDNIETLREYAREYRNINKDDINRKKRESSREYRRKNKKEVNKTERQQYHYQKSWGGDKRSNNNLLTISLDIFN